MRRPALAALACATGLAGLALAYALIAPSEPPAGEAALSVARALGESADSDAYARALAPREFRFPADHGAHPDYRNEWWYFTGNLTDPTGEAYGFQLVIFRIALAPEPLAGQSAWRDRQLYMGHFAVTDIDGGRFLARERFSRAAAGLAGAAADALEVWLEDWRIEQLDAAGRRFRLQAAAGDAVIDLELSALKPPALNGEAGLSRKSAEPGNASYYYSITRLAAEGSLSLDGQARPVTGSGWLDREWSTSALARDQLGWDWFALQLDDGTELMLYSLRREGGATDPHSAGTFVRADGSTVALDRDAFRITPLAHWRSPESGKRYPARWRVEVPSLELELVVEPRLADQELRLTVTYWEGAVRATGSRAGEAVAALGYVELAGY